MKTTGPNSTKHEFMPKIFLQKNLEGKTLAMMGSFNLKAMQAANKSNTSNRQNEQQRQGAVTKSESNRQLLGIQQ